MRCTIDLNTKAKTKKHLEQHAGRNLHDEGQAKIFHKKEILTNWTLSKSTNPCSSKDIVKEINWQFTEWEKNSLYIFGKRHIQSPLII